MKALNKFFYALLALATVGMVACSEDTTYEPGPAEVEGCYEVYFPDTEVLKTQGPTGDLSVEPSVKVSYQYTAFRNNFEGAITVPVKVVTNTDNLFTVSPLEFADGEEAATFTVTLSDEAVVGVPYTLELSIEDPQYVKQYENSNATTLSVTVTRAEWIDVGVCVHTEDMLNNWYGLGLPDLNVKMQVRADSIDREAFQAALAGTGSDKGLVGIYRMVNPYNEVKGLIKGLDVYDANVLIYVDDVDKVHIPLQKVGVDVNGGAVMIYSMVDYYLDNGGEPEDAFYGSIKNGVISFPVDMLLGCPGGTYVGSNTYYVNSNGGWTINLVPALNKYELVLPEGYEDNDFEFEEMELAEGSMFYSESQCNSWYPLLEVGTVNVTTDNVDRDFVARYGTLYRLPDLYEFEYPIYFAAKNGAVTLPAQYKKQNTGLLQNGYEVFMAIDASSSKFDAQTGALTLVAEFYTEQGMDEATGEPYKISYGVYNEVISVEEPEFSVVAAADPKKDFQFQSLFTDTLESDYLGEDKEDVSLEKGTCMDYYKSMAFEANYGTLYRIPSMYANNYDIYFVANADGKVSTLPGYELQATGLSTYGTATYVKILGGTMAKNGVTLSVGVFDAKGEALQPLICSESLYTYNWLPQGTGTYTSNVFKTPYTFENLSFENAEETNIYKVSGFWGHTGYDLMFTWNQTTNKCEVVGLINTGKYYDTDYMYVCDGKTFFSMLQGLDLTWEEVEAQGLAQPTFDPATNTFTFTLLYYIPELGEAYKGVDTFVLDGGLAAPNWVDVATGTYKNAIWRDEDGNPYHPQGIKMQQDEGTDKYRLVDWHESEGEYYLNFKMDATTNKGEIVGLNDTGIPGNIFYSSGVTENALVCDVRTFYKKLNSVDKTWEELAAQFQTDVQPSYDPETKTYTFYVAYVFPEAGAVLANNFFKEQYVVDDSAAAAPASVVRKVASTPVGSLKFDGTIVKPVKGVKTKVADKVKLSVASAKEARSLKTATPAKIENCKIVKANLAF